MNKLYYLTLLFDFYGELLTEKQKSVIDLYYFNDFSLNEIAEEHNITRQAVLDMIKRTEKLLNQYESKLMLVDKYINRKNKIEKILSLIDNPDNINEVKKMLSDMID
ncbi:MAG: YlxM family DNA-binding protein [Lachnospirales bacterium]